MSVASVAWLSHEPATRKLAFGAQSRQEMPSVAAFWTSTSLLGLWLVPAPNDIQRAVIAARPGSRCVRRDYTRFSTRRIRLRERKKKPSVCPFYLFIRRNKPDILFSFFLFKFFNKKNFSWHLGVLGGGDREDVALSYVYANSGCVAASWLCVL